MMLARSGFEVLGVDPSHNMIQQAKAQGTSGLGVQFRVAGETILEPHSYDAIVCSSVIEYVPEPARLLKLFRNSLRGPGVLIISFSNNRSPCRLRARLNGSKNVFAKAYQQGWSWRDFDNLLTRSGFGRIAGPRFFEFHWRLDRFVWWLPLGILGIVAARKRHP